MEKKQHMEILINHLDKKKGSNTVLTAMTTQNKYEIPLKTFVQISFSHSSQWMCGSKNVEVVQDH